jgi:hypothetical protein
MTMQHFSKAPLYSLKDIFTVELIEFQGKSTSLMLDFYTAEQLTMEREDLNDA